MDQKTKSREKILVAALILLAVVVRLAGLSFGLPYVYQVDEARFVQLSSGVFKGDLNPHWFYLPNLYIYLVAGAWEGVYLTGKAIGKFRTPEDFLGRLDTDPTLLYMIGRLVTALISILTIFFMYVLGKKMYDWRAGMLAALFLIFSLEHNRASHYLYPDAPMILFIVLSLLFVWSVYQEGKTRDYLLAGLFAGLAFATKYGGHVLFIPLVLAHVFRGLEQKRPLRKIVFSLPLIGSGVAFILAFLATCPYVIFDFATFKSHFNWQSAHLSTLGHYGTAESVSVPLFYLRYGFLENLGLIIQILALGGLILGFSKGRRREWILFSTPLILQVWVSTWKTYATRYMILSAPFFILIAAFFADWLLSRKPFGGAERTRWPGLALVALAVLPSAVRIFQFDVNLIRPDTRTVAKEWIETNLPPKTRIAMEQYGPPISPEVYHVYFKAPSLSQVNLDWLARRRIEYAVISDLEYARFVPYPKDFPSQVAFYRSLDEKAVLVKTFIPKWDDKLIDLHNPTLKIYRLSACPIPGFPGNFRKYAQSIVLVRTSDKAWTIGSSVKAAGLLRKIERVFTPYVRLIDENGREAARLVLKNGEFGAGGGSLSTTKSMPLNLSPGRYKAMIGYEFAFASQVPGLDPSRRFRKEMPLAEVLVDPGKPKKRIEYIYSFAAFPNTRGEDYAQSVILARTGSGWRLTSSIYGGELRFGDDYVLNPFVKVQEPDGRKPARLTLFEGKVGSFDNPKPGGVRATFKLPPFSEKPRLFAGYDFYYDNEKPDRAGGPAEVELLLPEAFNPGKKPKQ
jgi:hypothetical protein